MECRRGGALSLALALLGWSPACTLTAFDSAPCEAHSECRDAYGLGSLCNEEGLCTEPEIPERCNRSFPEGLLQNPELARSSIVFGSLFDARNTTHQARERSIRLALRLINERGLEGHSFGVVMCSIEPDTASADQGTTPGALSAAEYLTRVLEVPAIIGPATSTNVLAVFEAVRTTGTFLISPSATSPALATVDRTTPTDEQPGLLWRTAPPDSLQGQAIATDMMNRDVGSVAVIAEHGAYGEGLYEIFNKNYEGFVQLNTFRSEDQLKAALQAAGSGEAEEVLFIASAQSDVEVFLSHLAGNKAYASKGIFLTDSAATQSVLKKTPLDVVPRVRGTRPSQLTNEDFVYGFFYNAYRNEYKESVDEFSFAAHSYDATWVTALGAAWSLINEDIVTGLGIARGARRLSSGVETQFSEGKWLGAVQAFREGDPIDALGTSGKLDFSPETEETAAPIDVWTLRLKNHSPVLTVVEP